MWQEIYTPPKQYSFLPTPENPTGPWSITYGIHRGTLTSRNTDMPSGYVYATWNDVVAAMNRHIENYRSMGCAIWFAEAHCEDGRYEKILHGANYR